jgi:SAM-dependent methyltransferase
VVATAYGADLAYIHDVGYTDFARSAATWLLWKLRRQAPGRGLVIDLGCGSGIWARELSEAGYDVLGIDISAAMIALARRRVPRARFQVQSCLEADLPPCVAVTALGEIFSFLFDAGNTDAALTHLFRRVHAALGPRGLFIFDVAGPGRARGKGPQKHCREGDDWAILVNTEEDPEHRFLTRRITSFRKVGKLYRREHEVHRLRLYRRAELAGRLREIGFRVSTVSGYGALRFERGWFGLLARKPR